VDERWSIDTVATSVDCRGQGHASQLLADLIQRAQRASAASLHAELDIRNSRMYGLLSDVFGATLYPDVNAERVFAVIRLR
jgi:ribosomal protein S18 acetylase RimI-like enzyme